MERSQAQRPGSCVVLVSGITAISKLLAGQQSRGDGPLPSTWPGKLLRPYPSGTAAPALHCASRACGPPPLAVRTLALPYSSRVELIRLRQAIALLVATQRSTWGSQTGQDKRGSPEMIRSSLVGLRRAALHPATLSAEGRVGLGLARRALVRAPLPPMARLVARAGLVATEFVVAELIRRRHAASP